MSRPLLLEEHTDRKGVCVLCVWVWVSVCQSAFKREKEREREKEWVGELSKIR